MMLEPANVRTVLELLAQRFHDDLFGVVDLIDHQPESPVIASQHDDVDRALASYLQARLCIKFEFAAEINPEATDALAAGKPARRGPTPRLYPARRPRSAPIRANSPEEWHSSSLPQVTTRAGMMARVNGILTRTVVP